MEWHLVNINKAPFGEVPAPLFPLADKHAAGEMWYWIPTHDGYRFYFEDGLTAEAFKDDPEVSETVSKGSH